MPVVCKDHRPVQHRDGKPPWCGHCGLTEGMEVPVSSIHKVKSPDEDFDAPATCQYCLADPRYTGLGEDKDKRCPVCGAPYSGPRRSREYVALVEAGLVAKGD